eukprot:1215870-Rhodomonas_salina.4
MSLKRKPNALHLPPTSMFNALPKVQPKVEMQQHLRMRTTDLLEDEHPTVCLFVCVSEMQQLTILRPSKKLAPWTFSFHLSSASY